MNEEITKKERMLEKLRSEVYDKESTVFEKTTNYKAEEAQLKVRFENLKKAQQEL